jgi:hypothetical protein
VIVRLLDWRLRGVMRQSGLPDLPEVRRFAWVCWWNGFTGGRHDGLVRLLEVEAKAAVARYQRLRSCCGTDPSGGHRGTCVNSVMSTGEFRP